jgi:prophage antirepressor-like protein
MNITKYNTNDNITFNNVKINYVVDKNKDIWFNGKDVIKALNKNINKKNKEKDKN